MTDPTESLTSREKETLRMLLAGHEAKSIASELGLSVHTVNDRLRNARQKLGVTSSREAARILGEAEAQEPKNLAPEEIGRATPAAGILEQGHVERRRRGLPLVWLAGGMLIMSLIIALAVLGGVGAGGSAQPEKTEAVPQVASQGEAAARSWLKLTDAAEYEQSWQEAGELFHAGVTAERWAEMAKPVRAPLGDIQSRTLVKAIAREKLPNAPDGEYEMLEFASAFANAPSAIETVIMHKEGADWKVVGYFIR